MDIDEVDTASTPNKYKIEPRQQLVQKGQAKKENVVRVQQQVEPEAAKLQIQEYVFDGQTLSELSSKEEWLRSYRDRADKTFEETVELYREASRLPQPNVALKTIRDHATDTLSLALAVGNKVSKVNVSLSKVPTSDIINLNKEIGDILNTRLLKDAIQLSKSEESKART